MATSTPVLIWKSKQVMTSFIFGVLFAVFIGHAYMVYQTRALALQNRADIQMIASFIQQATGSTPVATGSTPTESNIEVIQ